MKKSDKKGFSVESLESKDSQDERFKAITNRISDLTTWDINEKNRNIEDDGSNLSRSTLVKVGHSGSVRPFIIERQRDLGPIVWNRIYTYSDRVFTRLRAAERAVRALALVEGQMSFLLTLTFPKWVPNFIRWRVNDRFRKNVRMNFPSGMWVVEAHTGEDFIDRDGNVHIGDPEMRGKIHFHYRVNTTLSWSQVHVWLLDQIIIDRRLIDDEAEPYISIDALNKNKDLQDHAYDVKTAKMKWLYLSLHESKRQQKDLIVHWSRLWATWGVDKKPEILTLDEMKDFDLYSVVANKEVYADSSIHVKLQTIKKLKREQFKKDKDE